MHRFRSDERRARHRLKEVASRGAVEGRTNCNELHLLCGVALAHAARVAEQRKHIVGVACVKIIII